MPRTLTAAALTAVSAPVTAPGYLVAITSTYSEILRYSTRGTLTYGGYTWVGGAQVTRQSPTDWAMSLPNTDNAASALVLGDHLEDATVSLSTYLDNASPPQTVLLFTGYVNQVVRVTNQKVEISLAAVTLGRSWLPDVILAPPICRHMPPPGTAISWRGKIYYLESGT